LFIAKAERIDTQQLEFEFAEKRRELDALAGTLGLAEPELKESDDQKAKDGKRRGKRQHNQGTGRRPIEELDLREETVEILDPHLEVLVDEGRVVRHGFEKSYKMAWKPGSWFRVVIARARYKTVDAEGNPDVISTPMPHEMLPGAMIAPSVLARLVTQNLGQGMPLYRLEDSCAREGFELDRASMARWKKLGGDCVAVTVVQAMDDHARAHAFCICTDATGVAIQPIPDGKRQPCKKGHFLVRIADRDHILFDYLERETSPTIFARFRGFSGYVQADAKAVYNLLFVDDDAVRSSGHDVEPDGGKRQEVGCWFHCRRRFWEAALAKSPPAAEALMRLSRLFELDASWRKKPPLEIKDLRQRLLRPHVDSFFAWVDEQRPLYQGQRGLLRTALEYAHNHQSALLRFFDDGRLELTNNRAERAQKLIALGRKAWLFCGSDDHARSTAAWLSLIASARLHDIEPQEYLRCLIRLVPLWPAERMLELAPLFWKRTRDRLDPDSLAAELGPIEIPAEPLDTSLPSQ
jgi:transposase